MNSYSYSYTIPTLYWTNTYNYTNTNTNTYTYTRKYIYNQQFIYGSILIISIIGLRFFSSGDHRSNRYFLESIDYRYLSNRWFFCYRYPPIVTSTVWSCCISFIFQTVEITLSSVYCKRKLQVWFGSLFSEAKYRTFQV